MIDIYLKATEFKYLLRFGNINLTRRPITNSVTKSGTIPLAASSNYF